MPGDLARSAAARVALLVLALAVAGCVHLEVLRVRNEAMRLYKEGRTAEAIPLIERTIAELEDELGPDHRYLGEAWSALGVLYAQALHDWERSEAAFRRALEIQTQALGAEHPDTIETLNLMGFLYQVTGDFARAEDHFTRALELRTRVLGPTHPDTAAAQIWLAGLHMAQARYDEARALYTQALPNEAVEVSIRHPSPAEALAGLAGVHAALGEYDAAERRHAEALAIRERELGPDHPEVAHLLIAMGSAAQRHEDWEQAERRYERALGIYERTFGRDHGWTAGALLALGVLDAMRGEYESAAERLGESLDIFRVQLGPDNVRTMSVELVIASLWLRASEWVHAAEASAPVLASPRLTQHPETRWTALAIHGLALYKRGEPAAGIFFAKQAVNQIQALRAGLRDGEAQHSFLLGRDVAFKNLAQMLIETGRLPEAQQVLRMLKEDEHWQFVRRDASRDVRTTRVDPTPGEHPWQQRYAEIEREIAALGSELSARRRALRRGEIPPDDAQLASLRDDMQVAQAAFREFLARLREEASAATPERAHEIGRKNLASLRAMQGTLRRLGGDAVLVHTLVTDAKLYLILTTPHSQLVRESEIPARELNRRIHALREALQSPAVNPLPAAQALHEVLVAPIAEDLRQAGARTLMFSMDGALRYVPVAALHDGTRWLAEDYAVVLFTAAAQTRLTETPLADWRLAGLGVTKPIEGFDPLPGVVTELEGIVRRGPEDADGVLPGVIHLDQSFTTERVTQMLDQGYPVLHIASHFVFRPGTERDSYLLLGDGDRLSLAEMVEAGLDFNDVDLLTLSACDTAMGGAGADGREIEGFGWLAQRQGAKAVLATLWAVADESTSDFMRRLYELRSEGLSKAEALRRAQLALMRGEAGAAPAPHPYYWAPYILMGNWL